MIYINQVILNNYLGYPPSPIRSNDYLQVSMLLRRKKKDKNRDERGERELPQKNE